ncbi:AzlD domain-containing protein [Archaeoglobus veneficus]|uniref:AzlD domain-containing protein n=1 Tax=Archaeoglobus veneficus TaxID=58290 RepID=UPI000A077A9B
MFWCGRLRVLLIVGMTAVTYIPRLLPMLASGRFESLNFLKYLPVAIFTNGWSFSRKTSIIFIFNY